MSSEQYHFQYIDSYAEVHDIPYVTNEYNSVMELLYDKCIEDWGDCKGKAWCATCHIAVQTIAPMDSDESNRIDQLSNKTPHSRLACQIPLDNILKDKRIQYIGDD